MVSPLSPRPPPAVNLTPPLVAAAPQPPPNVAAAPQPSLHVATGLQPSPHIASSTRTNMASDPPASALLLNDVGKADTVSPITLQADDGLRMNNEDIGASNSVNVKALSNLVTAFGNKVSHTTNRGDISGPIQPHVLKGAWTKRLNHLPSTSHQHSVREVSSVLWPSLAASKSTRSQKTCVSQTPVTVEDNIRFPWAAKMNPASRNLYRATEPKYLEDGTPKVTIPKHVFLQGLENQKEYVLGQFYRCSPPSGGLIYAVFNKLWGRNCRITVRKLGDSNYLFHIPDESTRTWVLQRGLWHVDDCLMFVASWTPEASLAIPEIKTIPVWVTLKKIPNILYSISGISHIASGLGAPMATYKPKLDPILMGEAKILVEVELSKAFPSRIAADDENGFISMVDVEYAWLPSKCERCGQLGHKVKRCLQAASDSFIVAEITEIAPIDSSVITTNILPKTAQPDSTTVPVSGIEVSPPNTLLDVNNESATVDPSDIVIADDLISLATISVLENMVFEPAPTFVYINEAIESPMLESAQISTVSGTLDAHANSTVERESSRIAEPDYGSNKFASLISLEEEEDSSDSDIEMDPMDLLTPTGKRILRERPVKPSAKVRDMYIQSTVRGRGTRGRGNQGGRG